VNKQTFIKKDSEKLLNIVLMQPDIPQNAGNIARLAMAVNAQLVLVRPLGFRLTDQSLLRAGMDYWKSLEPIILDDMEEFMQWSKGKRLFFLSAHTDKNYAQIEFQKGDVLVFGSESQGLPKELFNWAQKNDLLITLPMVPDARCINVSSSAAAVVYEALNQILKWNG
jgi:tRNA (cytidine/uridine-2'-O-)-methyltransferase